MSSLIFLLGGGNGTQIGSFFLHSGAFAGAGWYDDEEEVLEVRSGVIQLLIAPVKTHDD
jgi:hypothetical protein